jgi:PhnB protein
VQINPYLNFNGQCAEAFRFYEQVLGGEIKAMFPFSEMPGENVPPELKDGIMHASLLVGDQALFGSDAPTEMYQKPQGLYVSLNVEQPSEARRIFDSLADGGSVTMPFQQTFWAAGGFGMLVDRYGTPWMINCEQAA